MTDRKDCQILSSVGLLCPSSKLKKVWSLGLEDFSPSSILDRPSAQTVCYGWNLNEFLPSHFCVWSFYSLVTKVKGLSDLSEKAKIGERTETTTKRSRGAATSNERPGPAQGKHTSLKVGKLTRNLNYCRCWRFIKISKGLWPKWLRKGLSVDA